MKRTGITVIMLLLTFAAWSQTDKLDSLLNDVVWDDGEMSRLFNPPSSFCYLYGGVAGENKTMYAGRELEENMMAINGNLYFFHAKGFFIGASGAWYGEPVDGYSVTVASAGLNTPLNIKRSLNLRASYSRYFYANNDTATENPYTNNLGIGISLRNSRIGGRLSINMLFGQDFGMNLTPTVFSRLPIVKFGKYNKIQFEPELSAFFGSESVELEKISGTNPQQSGSQTTSTTENTYGLLNTRFYLPICFYIGDFDLELGYSINIPSTQDDYTKYPVSSLFSFSIGYLLPLN